MTRNIATLSSKFQISVPQAVRLNQNWGAGDKLAFVPRGRGVMLVRVPTLQELRGIAAGADPSGYRDREDRF